MNNNPVLIVGMQKNQSVKTDGICTTLTSSMGCGGGYVPMVVVNSGQIIIRDDFNSRIKTNQSVIGTLTPNSGNSTPRNGIKIIEAKGEDMRIRKLTPKECWRLMGFDDEDFSKAEAVNSNTQLYKQAGNSIVVDVLEEIFCQIFDQNGEIYV